MNVVRSGVGLGSKLGTENVIDALRGAQRVSLSPYDHSDLSGNLLGFYSANFITGNIAATLAAASPLVSMRWSSTSSYAVILGIRAGIEIVTAVTAATIMDLEAIIARSFTVADTTGTATTPSKMRGSMATSAFADLRVATTATLTAGTRTLDSVGFAFANFPILQNTNATGTAVLLAVGNGAPMQDLYRANHNGGHPVVLAANEGLVIRNSTASAATGTWKQIVTVEWAELAYF